MYRHALPPGFVLKKDKKKEEKEDEISLEDLIEREVTGIFFQHKTLKQYCEILIFTTWGQQQHVVMKGKKYEFFSKLPYFLFDYSYMSKMQTQP